MEKFKRRLALLAVILWGLVIAVTVVVAFVPGETAHKLFIGLIYTDIGLPIVIYAMMMVARILSKKGSDEER